MKISANKSDKLETNSVVCSQNLLLNLKKEILWVSVIIKKKLSDKRDAFLLRYTRKRLTIFRDNKIVLLGTVMFEIFSTGPTVFLIEKELLFMFSLRK